MVEQTRMEEGAAPGRETLAELAALYRTALLDDVMPFWADYSIDREYGGYFTCLARDGSVFDTDKFVWLQGRQVWMYSKLYNELEERPEWIEAAELGARFLRAHGRDSAGDWFFSLTREGKPLTRPYNIFSDCFAAMAFGEFARATGDEESKRIARATYSRILDRQTSQDGRYSKQYPGTRPLTGLALPMILSNLTLELAWLLTPKEVDNQCRTAVGRVFGLFLDDDLGVLHENVAPDGTLVDSFEGRVVIPGHGIEAMWFAMDIAQRIGDPELIAKAIDVTLATLEFGWDEEFGGIFYFLDTHGYPPQELEWDQKLWWVHLETLISLLMGYRLTGRDECWFWFERIHDYTWSHFPDPKFGEWYGYLNRRGEVLLPLKGGKWKGCFHVPRGLYRCAMELEKLLGE